MTAHPWWRISRRNLGRNTRRTVIAALGLALSFFAVVILIGMMQGMTTDMIENGTGILTGQVQLHAAGYLPDRSVYETIGGDRGIDVAAVLDSITADPEVVAAAPRVYGGGLVSTGSATAAAVLLGIDPAREPRVARLTGAITAGRMPRPGEAALLIGTELARRAHAAPGDTVVLVAPAADGTLGNDLYTVAGVFSSGLAELDATFALLPIDRLQGLMALDPGRVHEIAIHVRDPLLAPEVAARLDRRLAGISRHAAVEPWTTFSPELADYAQLMRASNWLVLLVVFGMAIFGIANTLLMATFERRREFALLLALGARPGKILRTVFYEAFALGAVSLAAGAAITIPVLIWWHHRPPDLSRLFGDFTIAGALVRPVLRTDYPYAWGTGAALALLVTALLAAIVPAIRASRIPPADTLSGR